MQLVNYFLNTAKYSTIVFGSDARDILQFDKMISNNYIQDQKKFSISRTFLGAELRSTWIVPAKTIGIILICFIMRSTFTKAQQPADVNYRTINWNIESGLSQGEVFGMIKDKNGFLWICTQFGVNRFDGSKFENYFASRGKKNKTIIGNQTFTVIEDSLHNLWFGTSKGISRYDINADSFTHVTGIAQNVSAAPFMPFWATKKEVFVFDYTSSELSAFNIYTYSKRFLAKILPEDTVGSALSDMYPVYDEVNNSIWLQQGIPPWASPTSRGGLLQISLADGKKQRYNWPCSKNIPYHNHFSEGMRYDRQRNSIWINSPDGLIEFELSRRKFRHMEAMKHIVALPDYHAWTGIDIDTLGRVWLGTFPKGILIYDPKTATVAPVFPKNEKLQLQVSESNVLLYCDRDGMVWSGSWARKGVNQFLPFSPAVTRYLRDTIPGKGLSTNEVYNCISVQNKIWIGTGNGLNIFNPADKTFEVLKLKDLPGLPNMPNQIVLPIAANTVAQKAWLSNHQTPLLYEMDMRTNKCIPIPFQDSSGNLRGDLGFSIIKPYQDGCVGLLWHDNLQSLFVVSPDRPVANILKSFPANSIAEIYTTIDNRYIFMASQDGTNNTTFEIVGGKLKKVETEIDNIKWSRIIYSEHDRTYWVYAYGELSQFSNEPKLLKKFTFEQGLPVHEIYNLVADNSGNIWFNTDRSIYTLNITKSTIKRLSELDGFKNQNFINTPTSNIKDDAGLLYFPCGRVWGAGLDVIDPLLYKESYMPSSVYVRSIKINEREIPNVSSIDSLNRFELKYDQNKLTVETGIIDYYTLGGSQIRYRLEGITNDWQHAPANYTIRYEELPPGTYTLQMQATNAANEFNGAIKNLLFIIAPPFWTTWWFRLAAGLVVVFGIYVVLKKWFQQKYRLRLERSERDKQLATMRQKASELEMQALRSQMNPHFIFNSLNSINRFIMQNNKVQASEYLTKFSRLVRLILQNSQAPLITMESELESMELYLDLEALRFNNRFGYKISVPKELDISALKVPPLIIQPYAENAIWHGLMHKEERGQLDIEVTEEGDNIFFRISDDGIGRKRSAAMSSKSATRHKSMGLRITADRIAMMQKIGSGQSAVTINDLQAPDGTDAGTEVIIKLPVIYD